MRRTEKELLLAELSKVATALGQTFAPFCEVILSDLTTPDHVIQQVENSLSGREVGDPASLIGLARLTDPTFPDILTNYADAFRDGRPVKSTSIGIRDSSGNYVAALYLNIDVSYIKSVVAYLNEMIKVEGDPNALYHLAAEQSSLDIHAKIARFAAQKNCEPRSLKPNERRELIKLLAEDGEFEIKGAAERIASIIGLKRTQIYYYLKDVRN